MNSTYPTASRIQRITQHPLARLIIGLLMILIPVAVGQSLVLSLSVSRLWRSILVIAVTVPVSYAAYYVLVHYIERRELTELRPSRAAPEITQGIVLGAVLCGSIVAILGLAGAWRVLGTNGASVLVVPLIFAVNAGIFEEILFRGVLFRVMEEGLGSWLALAISGVLFGGSHLLNEHATAVGVVAVMFAGIALAGCFMMTRRLWMPIGFHLAWNFTQAGIFGLSVSGGNASQGLLQSSLSGPDWLAGGVFGIEASVVTFLVSAVVSVLFLRAAWKRGNFIQPYWRRSHEAQTEPVRQPV